MGNRKLVEFNMTREEIPPTPDHDWKRETPYVASMANEELRIGPETDHARFQKVLILGEQMIELANPGMAAMDTDRETDANGHVIACTVTVVPTR
ncbi:MAG: hypothetical protein WB800_18590 [Streptosporangiaceae bacterium]